MYDTVPSEVSVASNLLLAALPENERSLVSANAALVPLKRRAVLHDPDAPIDAVYFIVDGIASLLSVMSDGTAVETATIGREGMVGMPVFHGVDATPEQAMMQIAGSAYRIEAGVFRDLLPELPTLDALLHRFSVVMFTLAAQNSGCNRKHSIEERCARWLLMVSDRLDRDTLELTHDFVAQMLGVRRASVTETLGAFERRGYLEMGRGRIRILNRDGLLEAVCECYAIIRGTTQRLLEGTPTVLPIDDLQTSVAGESTLGAPED